MSYRVCKTCGEEYSDTYKRCPFCEEEEAIKRGHPPHRHNGGKRLEKQRQRQFSGGAGGVMMLLTAVIILGVVAYVFLGDQIAETFGIRSDPAQLGFGETDGTDQDNPEPDPAPDDGQQVTSGPLTLSQGAMTISAGETALLVVTGADGLDLIWSSSDERIAIVAGGVVTGIAGGTATISAVSGENSVACSVQVNGDPPVEDEPSTDGGGNGASSSPGTTPPSTSTPGTTKLSLNKTDFSIRSGDPAVQMKVNGASGTVTWASKNTSVATVSQGGLVTRVGVGTTTITATVDGQTLECIVRCKS